MKKAIVVGATSGIGRALAVVLAQNGYAVGLAGRRFELLNELQGEIATLTFRKQMDVANASEAMTLLEELMDEMGGADLVVISAGVGFLNRDLAWEEEKSTIEVNVLGFTAMATAAFRHFARAGKGHLVGISSIGAIRGSREAPAYNASKAFVSNYLEGLRCKAVRECLDIAVTDIQPGFVDTAMAKGEGLFWVSSPRKAAQQIYGAIERKAMRAFITRRWGLVACLLKIMPNFLYARL